MTKELTKLTLLAALALMPCHARCFGQLPMEGKSVVKFETLSATTELGKKVPKFCIRKVSPHVLINSIQTTTNLRQYECEVHFSGEAQEQQVSGIRRITYKSVAVIQSRSSLKDQSDYIAEHTTPNLTPSYISIPNSVFSSLPNASAEMEEQSLAEKAHTLIPTTASMQAAAKTGCLLALLETIDNACSKSDFDEIRKTAESNIQKITNNNPEKPRSPQ